MRNASALLVALLWCATAEGSDVISLDLLPCGKPGEAGGLAAGSDLARMTVDTRHYPAAVCNDGTPAVYYVRPYTGEENRNRWLIMLQGGGSCRSGQTCAERWCSVGTNFGMDKMTTSLAKPFINGGGILSPEPRNQFGRWNTVLVYYCSSDGWAGRKGDLELTASSGTDSLAFRMHFRGGDIVTAVFDSLRNPARTRGARSGGTPIRLPDLDEATQVLFVGASGGGNGVNTNADRVGELLRANNVACGGSGCPLDYRVAIDSAFAPEREKLDFTTTVSCAGNPALCSWEGFTRGLSYEVSLARNEVSDTSCLEYHRQVEPESEWQCSDTTHVIRHHITTPMFVGQDLQDPQVGGNFVEEGFGSGSEFGMKIESELRALSTLDTSAEEGSALTGTPLVRPGAWGPQCTGHELLGSSDDFYRTFVSAGGASLSYHDTLWNWWSGGSPTEAIGIFTAPGAVPECP